MRRIAHQVVVTGLFDVGVSGCGLDDPPTRTDVSVAGSANGHCAGLTDQAIARHLDIGQRTVERHLSRIMTELGAKTRFQAGVQAHTRGWLTSPDPATAPSQP